MPAACASQSGTLARTLCVFNVFTKPLSTTQQANVQLALTTTNAARWSNLPVGMVPRNGLEFGSLSSAQLDPALAVARAVLSDTGFATFQAIRAADTYLGQSANGYGENLYYVAALGTPSATSRWLLQIGGHHYGPNFAFNGPSAAPVAVTATPFFIGVEPQTFTLNGTAYTPLQSRKVAMYTVINALDATQEAQAKLSASFDDVLVGPGKDGQFPTQQGLVGTSLTAAQRALVQTAILQWVHDLATPEANALMADYAADSSLAKTYVAWATSTDSTVQGSYLRIDGPRVWIEFACQGGIVFRNQIHFHTIWRDKLRDYGGSISTASVRAAEFGRQLAEARVHFAPAFGRADEWPIAG
ncbi:MAG TPA: DUF3500 domain-containing protein [Gemmatirosa sp.]